MEPSGDCRRPDEPGPELEVWPSARDVAGPDEPASAGYGRIWEVATGKPIGSRLDHSKAVLDIRFDAAGERIATASEDGTVRVWDAHTGKSITEPLQHERPYTRSASALTGYGWRPSPNRSASGISRPLSGSRCRHSRMSSSPTIRPTVSRSSRSSMAKTTREASCRTYNCCRPGQVSPLPTTRKKLRSSAPSISIPHRSGYCFLTQESIATRTTRVVLTSSTRTRGSRSASTRWIRRGFFGGGPPFRWRIPHRQQRSNRTVPPLGSGVNDNRRQIRFSFLPLRFISQWRPATNNSPSCSALQAIRFNCGTRQHSPRRASSSHRPRPCTKNGSKNSIAQAPSRTKAGMAGDC